MSGTSSGLPGSGAPNSGVPGPDTPRKRIRLRPRDVLFLLAVAAGVAFLSAPQLFAPWVYFTGGSFHVGPWWSGAGSFTAPDGTYQIDLYLGPMNEGSHATLRTPLEGDGHLCTPSGERLIIHVEGDMDRHLPANTIGKSIEISTFTRSKPGSFGPMIAPGSPYLRLNGVWGVGKIEATGEMGHEADGPGKPEPKRVPVAVTLMKSSEWWPPACKER